MGGGGGQDYLCLYVFCHFQSGVSSSCKPTLSIFCNHFAVC